MQSSFAGVKPADFRVRASYRVVSVRWVAVATGRRFGRVVGFRHREKPSAPRSGGSSRRYARLRIRIARADAVRWTAADIPVGGGREQLNVPTGWESVTGQLRPGRPNHWQTLGPTTTSERSADRTPVWVDERGRPLAGRRPVVVSATPIRANAVSEDMSLSDRERAGAFWVFVVAVSAVAVPILFRSERDFRGPLPGDSRRWRIATNGGPENEPALQFWKRYQN